jgi:hypothetical protein
VRKCKLPRIPHAIFGKTGEEKEELVISTVSCRLANAISCICATPDVCSGAKMIVFRASHARAAWWQYNPIENISGFVEATYLAGLRKAGLPEE